MNGSLYIKLSDSNKTVAVLATVPAHPKKNVANASYPVDFLTKVS